MSQLPPEIQIMRLANAFQLSRSVQVAARLGIGRLLAGGPRSTGELAQETETDEGVLGRLLRFLAELGVVAELDDGRFGPTPLSERLHLADNVAQGEEAWAAWSALPQALETGRTVFASVHGADFYEYLGLHPEQAANWNEWMAAMGGTLAPAVAAALELSGAETVVDVGGGEGAVLAEILGRHPGCRGILFDFPGTVDGAQEALERAGAGGRFEVVAGDATIEVPRGGDVYLVSRVLQNCDDQRAAKLFANCRAAMGPRSRLAVVEALMPERGDPRRRTLAAGDLNYFLLWGGGHRTRAEMEALLERADLAVTRMKELPGAPSSPWQLIEARRSR